MIALLRLPLPPAASRFCAALTVLIAGCGDRGEQLSELTKIRVPVAQFFAEAAGDAAKRAGCETWPDAKVYCQQYPLYFGKAYKIRFVAISPEGEKASMRITGASRYTGLSPQQRAVTSFNAKVALPLASLGITGKADAANSRVRSEKTMRIEEIVFDLKVPTLEEVFTAGSDPSLPIYAIDYAAKSGKGGRTDAGFVTFFAYPERPDRAGLRIDAAVTDPEEKQQLEVWLGLKKQAAQRGVEAKLVDDLFERARRNTPPSLAIASPKSGAVTSQEFELRATLGSDPDKDAKRRLQWFVTRGELANQGSAKTKWKTEGAGRAGAFAVLRDMQGGQAYAYTIADAK